MATGSDEQEAALREMVSSSVRDALGSVAQDLCEELSRHVDAHLRETAHPKQRYCYAG